MNEENKIDQQIRQLKDDDPSHFDKVFNFSNYYPLQNFNPRKVADKLSLVQFRNFKPPDGFGVYTIYHRKLKAPFGFRKKFSKESG